MRSLSRALVVGGAGFLGGWLVEALADAGIEPVVLDRSAGGDRPAGIERIAADVLTEDLGALFRTHPVDAVFQLAGTSSVPGSVERPAEDLTVNGLTTLAVLEAARTQAQPPLVVFLSSAAVYGNGVRMPMDEDHPLDPVSPYGISKLAAERYVSLYAGLHGLSTFSVRPFSLYGPRQRKLVVFDLMQRVRGGEDPLVVRAPPDVTRDFVFVEDAARALVTLALRVPAEGEAYNLASGHATTLRDLVEELLEATGSSSAYRFTGALRPGDPARWEGDASRASAFGVEFPTSLHDGLEQTAVWLRESGDG